MVRSKINLASPSLPIELGAARTDSEAATSIPRWLNNPSFPASSINSNWRGEPWEATFVESGRTLDGEAFWNWVDGDVLVVLTDVDGKMQARRSAFL